MYGNSYVRATVPMDARLDKTVRRMINAGQLTSRKIRGLRLIRWSDLSQLLNQTA